MLGCPSARSVAGRRRHCARPLWHRHFHPKSGGSPPGQRRPARQVCSNLMEDHGLRPGRVGHALLDRLPVASIQAPIHVLEVAVAHQGQQSAQVGVHRQAGIARAILETRPIPLPEPVQAQPQVQNRFQAQAPPAGIKPIQGVDGRQQRWFCVFLHPARNIPFRPGLPVTPENQVVFANLTLSNYNWCARRTDRSNPQDWSSTGRQTSRSCWAALCRWVISPILPKPSAKRI